MKQNTYEIEKNSDKIRSGGYTGFLTRNVCIQLKNRLKKNEYEELLVYPDTEKVILYSKIKPVIRLFRIDSYEELKHSSILGSLFALNIEPFMFGDIVFYNNNFYIYLMDSISELIKNEFVMVGNCPIKLIEVSLDTLNSFKRDYEDMELIVSSLRVDTICSKIISGNRDSVRDKIRDKEILVNYEILKKPESLLSVGDVFSIRKYGKFRFQSIVGRTKKENYIILIQKYI